MVRSDSKYEIVFAKTTRDYPKKGTKIEDWELLSDVYFLLNKENGYKKPYYDCKCKCGKIKTVNAHEIIHNKTRSCGCIKKGQKRQIKKRLGTWLGEDGFKQCSECKNILHFKCYNKNTKSRDKLAIWCKNCEHKYRTKRKFNIELDMSKEFSCEICGLKLTTPNDNVYETVICLDHCHETGKFRGTLCRHCNLGIGSLRDDPNILANAAEYLRKHKQS